MTTQRQPWIYSAAVDGWFILAPSLVITALVLLFQKEITAVDAIPVWLWGILVVGVDVGHVYATLFRTYADPLERRQHPTLYSLVPLICWIGGTLIYSLDALWFWRVLAYLAVFHFMRQQYGFMMIYGRKEQASRNFKRLDQVSIYMATLYPLIYWHSQTPRQFDWFVENDFLTAPLPWLNQIGLTLYGVTLLAYLAKECFVSVHQRKINLPKNLLLVGTACSWFVGIVYFDNDLAFTATNVIAHGIPYIALIWIYGRNRGDLAPQMTIFNGFTYRSLFKFRMLPFYIGALLMLGYLEEGLWDGLIWTEHKNFFHVFQTLPLVNDKPFTSWLIPLLALPQMTHYVLDAFIWRLNKNNTDWKKILFARG